MTTFSFQCMWCSDIFFHVTMNKFAYTTIFIWHRAFGFQYMNVYGISFSTLQIIAYWILYWKNVWFWLTLYHNIRHFLVNSILVTNCYFTVVCIDKIYIYQTIETKLLFNQIKPRMVHWVHWVHSKSHYCADAVLFCFVSHWLVKLWILGGVTGLIHDDVIKWKLFPRYWPFVWGFTGHQWIPLSEGQ